MTYIIYFRVGIFLLLLVAFGCLFYYLRKNRIVEKNLHKALETIDSNSLEREREAKRALSGTQQGLLDKLDKKLGYSGLKHYFPFLTIEIWLLVIIGASAIGYFLVMTLTESWMNGILAAACMVGVFVGMEGLLARRNYHITEDALMEFVNLLGNYSITAGEVTGILGQISKYFKDPISYALDACYYEAQVTGDGNKALLTLADTLEHPQFKEIIRNIEICSRYTTDFDAFIKSTKKELKSYYSGKQERKAMANEAFINMIIIIGMLIVALLIVDTLIEVSIWSIVFHTWIGRGGLIVAGIFIALFMLEISVIER